MQSNRRKFIKQSVALAAAGVTAPLSGCSPEQQSKKATGKGEPAPRPLVGHGDFTYKVHKEWGNLDPYKTPVNDCHEMVQDAKGRLILATNEKQNNILIYDRSGKLLDSWTLNLVSTHGLTLATENEEEFLFITASDEHKVFKTTLDGKVLMEMDYPKETGVYAKQEEYKPTEVAIGPTGDIYVADGYGKNYIIQYSPKGEYIRHWGGAGKEDGQFECAHGITLDSRNPENPILLITSRSNQRFKKFTLEGEHIETVEIPGAWICRPVIHGENLYFAVIVTKTWSTYDGCIIVLDKDDKVVSVPGGLPPVYANGVLENVQYDGITFLNPHDVCIDRDENLYIPQWYSGRTYPVMLERV